MTEVQIHTTAGRISDLAQAVSGSMLEIEKALPHEGYLNGDHIAALAQDGDHDDLHKARLATIDHCKAILDLVIGPTEMLKNMALIDKHNLISLQIINHFGIADIVPLTGSISQTAVAEACGLASDVCSRVLRQAITYKVFCEPKCGDIAHTDASRVIVALSPLLSYQLEVCLPSTVHLLEWLKLAGKEDNIAPRSAFQIAHSTTDTWWTYAEKSPKLTQNYGKYMALITSGGPHDVSHVISGFDWAGLGNAVIIDVGGADGFVGITLAQAMPDLSIIVQDSAYLKDSADTKIPPSLKNRVVFTPGSFFEPQSGFGRQADVFLLRHILHDWEDQDCLSILRHLTESMKPGSRIIVAEQVMAAPGENSPHYERIMRALDMQMMVQFGSKERTMEDWERLFAWADPLLKVVNCTTPPGSADTLIELMMERHV